MLGVAEGAANGCFLAVPKSIEANGELPMYPEWCLGVSKYDSMDDSDIPDISIDPDDGVLSVINSSTIARTYFVTVEGCQAIFNNKGENLLSSGHHSRSYVTFVVLALGGTCVDLVRLEPKGMKNRRKLSISALNSIKISSDMQDYDPSVPEGEPFLMEEFPLEGSTGFMCTQSSGGSLTHFAHRSTYHAVDFKCEIGTPVRAIFDGTVVDIRNDSTNSGVRVEDLFHWNSILLKSSEGEIYCEYVHVSKDSFRVDVGSTVSKGQVLCLSGAVGFCPEPHLHLEIHRSPKPGTDSVQIQYKGKPFIPGEVYS